jgi:hypothetical protein
MSETESLCVSRAPRKAQTGQYTPSSGNSVPQTGQARLPCAVTLYHLAVRSLLESTSNDLEKTVISASNLTVRREYGLTQRQRGETEGF